MSTPALHHEIASEPTALQQAFGLWSQVYDEQLNPLLSLEERYLAHLLPDVRGLDVVDAGCGTGRWLSRLAGRFTNSLVGVDTSSDMLDRASVKLGGNADLRLGGCTALPVQDCSTDLVIASFVLSYIQDLESFAAEVDRICRPGTSVFLADMHPDTASSCNWRRSFRVNGTVIEIETREWTIEKIVRIFDRCGFEMLALIEPAFGDPEKSIFEQNRKLELFHLSTNLPAIYVLHLQKIRRLKSTQVGDIPHIHLTGARCALGSGESIAASLRIESGHIRQLSNSSLIRQEQDVSSVSKIDLNGYMLLPGLINSHDHLEFGLFPNIGHGPYENSAQWANDIHSTDALLIRQHRSIPIHVRLWWGAIRNLLSGVTTVCHHNPLALEVLDAGFPVRVLARFGWAHSLGLDPEVANKFHATPRNLPFILHAAEGTCERSTNEIFDLDRMNVLDARTVIVHGVALNSQGAALLNQRGASLVFCPTSNRFLFRRLPSRELIVSLTNVVLGTDSPLTAAGDLLDEIRFAHRTIGLGANELYEMVTTRPAKIFRLYDGEGCMKAASVADLIAVRDTGESPADTLASLTFADVELVLLRGRVQLASTSLLERLPETLKHGLQPLEVNGHIRWIRAPLDKLFAESEKVLGGDIRIGGKKVVNVNHL